MYRWLSVDSCGTEYQRQGYEQTYRVNENDRDRGMADCNKQGDGEGEPGVHVIFQICTILIVEVTYQMDEFRQKISGRTKLFTAAQAPTAS